MTELNRHCVYSIHIFNLRMLNTLYSSQGVVAGIFQTVARRGQRKNPGAYYDFGLGGRMKSGATESNSGQILRIDVELVFRYKSFSINITI